MAENTYYQEKPIGFEITSSNPKYINNSEVLAFRLNTYDETMPEFQIVLDFITETGGVL